VEFEQRGPLNQARAHGVVHGDLDDLRDTMALGCAPDAWSRNEPRPEGRDDATTDTALA
jgi:hypothetical protein